MTKKGEETGGKKKNTKPRKSVKKTKEISKPAEVELVSKDRHIEVREEIKATQGEISTSYLKLSVLLNEAWQNGYHVRWGYEKFDEYVDKELGFQYRKARYFIQIGEMISRFKIDIKDIEDITWTKMRALVPNMNESNVDELLDKARTLSVKDLEDELRPVTTRETKSFTLKVTLDTDAATTVQAAIESAQNQINSKDMGLALEHICYRWFAIEGDEMNVDLEALLAHIEKVYDVRVTCEAAADIDDIIAETTQEAQEIQHNAD